MKPGHGVRVRKVRKRLNDDARRIRRGARNRYTRKRRRGRPVVPLIDVEANVVPLWLLLLLLLYLAFDYGFRDSRARARASL